MGACANGGDVVHGAGGRKGFKNDKNDATGGGYIDENGEMQEDGVNRNTDETAKVDNAIYETAQDYIDSLNSDGTWIIYDSETNTATITSVEGLLKIVKTQVKM